MDSAHWQARLDDLARRYDVPGAALGVLRLGPEEERLELATGVLHRGTGVAATPDSLFQVGSITKVWTTTLLMTLVEEGLLDLDVPVATLLPDFRVADPGASARITVRHLLSHTSGFDGDMFVDTGRGDDCVAAFVGQLGGSRQLFAPGTAWSYNNAGFVAAGRVAEVLTGSSWDAALRERVVAPLGVSRTVTLPEEVLLHRAAVGHLEDADGHPGPAPVWSLPRSCGPAGLVCSTVGDQLHFAAAHLRGGLLPDGSRLLSADAAAAMASEQAARVDVTGHDDASTWGLGWARGAWAGSRVLGHDGNTIGQSAYLRLLPEHGVATVLLTNGGTADGLHRTLVGELLRELVGVTVSPAITPGPGPGVLPERVVGSWAQASARLDVRREGDGLVLRHTDTTPFAELDPDPVWERPLAGYADGVLLVQRPHTQTWAPLTLETTADGVDLLHLGWRAHTRV